MTILQGRCLDGHEVMHTELSRTVNHGVHYQLDLYRSVALPALRTGSPAPYTAHFPPAAARGPMAFGLRLVRHFFLSFFLYTSANGSCAAAYITPIQPHPTAATTQWLCS
jgi:hypothetical protein